MRGWPLALAVTLAACSPQALEVAQAAGAAAGGLPLLKAPAPAPAAAPSRPNAEMAEDILDLAFRLESGRDLPRLARFEGPIAVAVRGRAPATLGADLDALLARLRDEAGLDVARAAPEGASVVIEAVPQADLAREVPGAACFVVPEARSWDEFLRLRGTAALDWARVQRRRRAAIFVPADAPPQEVRDCLHEELAQAIGPLNDLYRLPDSVFNDDNIHAVLTGFDMLVLRALHAPELAQGMTREEVAARLPAILARLNPAGEGQGPATDPETPPDWVEAIEAALSGALPPEDRRQAAEAAVAITRAQGWTGTRLGLSLYALGRLQAPADPAGALAAFEAAEAGYAAQPETAIHRAHVAVQLAAFALASGDVARVLALADAAIPVAEAHANAGLQATLLMFRAEALDAVGEAEAARAARLDGLALARYGFGAPDAVRARLAEVRALNPFLARG